MAGNFDNKEFPNSGAMFQREKKSQKAADFGGDFTISGEVLQYVMAQAQAGLPVKLEISGWKRIGQNNMNFLSISIQTPYELRKGNQGNQSRQNFGSGTGGGYNRGGGNFGVSGGRNGGDPLYGNQGQQSFQRPLNQGGNQVGNQGQGAVRRNGWDD